MATLVVPHDAIIALLNALKAYHNPRPEVVFDRESLGPHKITLVAMSRFKRIGAGFSGIEVTPSQIEALLIHMRLRGMTQSKVIMDAATRIRASLSVLEEIQA